MVRRESMGELKSHPRYDIRVSTGDVIALVAMRLHEALNPCRKLDDLFEVRLFLWVLLCGVPACESFC
jgi:hypothetical protein